MYKDYRIKLSFTDNNLRVVGFPFLWKSQIIKLVEVTELTKICFWTLSTENFKSSNRNL